MSFYSSIINWIRGLRKGGSLYVDGNKYVFGTIISGEYANWKTDKNPTILCFGNYFDVNKNNWKVHGIQLHHINPYDLQWLMQQLLIWRKNEAQIDPRSFYYYLKKVKPEIIKNGYRVYHTELTSFKTISPGISSVSLNNCVSVFDTRDNIVQQFNSFIKNPSQILNYKQSSEVQEQYNTEELNSHIAEVTNQRKLW